jgi:hypothetical protein
MKSANQSIQRDSFAGILKGPAKSAEVETRLLTRSILQVVDDKVRA